MKRNYHPSRPGVVAASRLLNLSPISDHVDRWDRALSNYDAMIRAKGGSRLVELDARREDLPTARRRRSPPSNVEVTENDALPLLTKGQLLDVIVEWKFLKGKPRNALRPLLRSNSDSSVVSASRRAFAAADGIITTPTTMDVDIVGDGGSGDSGGHRRDNDDDGSTRGEMIANAVNCMCEIRGVGPATASAVLCLYRPDVFAYMDDEVIECLYDGRRGYTLGIYKEVNRRCTEIACQLNEAAGMKERKKGCGDSEGSFSPSSSSSGGGGWTPCKVGKALWSVATMSAYGDERGLSTIFNGVDATCVEGGNGSNENAKSTQKSRKRTKRD
ncbi:hypothetical protein ACHAXA_011448 [Cyclostephanos tholiformis]|uniref:HhH-GPD domain-containing protein n=1 Tax=Cyclostephanos tholiformis TaxID=382380 RepID=A0ABD3RVV8_9STRA